MASYPNSIQKLKWAKKSEILEYHSCGCADSCWVAELKSKRTKKLKVRLRCDCEKLHVLSPKNKTETTYDIDCKVFENDDKFKAITSEIKKISQ